MGIETKARLPQGRKGKGKRTGPSAVGFYSTACFVGVGVHSAGATCVLAYTTDPVATCACKWGGRDGDIRRHVCECCGLRLEVDL